MYKILKIGGRDYRLEYSIEASLYPECVEGVMGIFGGAALVDEGELNIKERLKAFLSTLSNVPQTALTVFFAGLMEAHGIEGDKSVTSISDAKKLLATYISEHKEDDTGNFYGILGLCVAQMEEDGFFDLIGLTKIGNQDESKEKKQPKTPQDYKKKETKASAK